jgi:DNA-binding CsgD family transcriptional regulator
MQTEPDVSLRAAHAAYQQGDWPRAADVYQSLVDDDPDDLEALDGLAQAKWWMCEIDLAVELRERAYAGFRRLGDVCRAADIALWLSVEYSSSYASAAVADGWFRRAERLLVDTPLCAAQVEVEVGRGRRAPDAEQAESHYARAAELARELGSTDLEIRALTQIGVLQVSLGRVEEGMALLDECMAAATGGEMHDPWQIGGTCCMMLSACDQLSDLDRAAQWCRVVTDFTRRRKYTPLFAWCRSIYAGVLIATGEWQRAEIELQESLETYAGHGHPRPAGWTSTDAAGRPMSMYPLARLAELRLRQGRLEEATQLIAGQENHVRAVATAIALDIERSELDRAEQRLEHRLAGIEPDHPAAAPLLPLLVSVRLRRGDMAGAADAVERLLELARALGRETLVGVAELRAADVSAAREDGASIAHLEVALEIFHRLGMPHEQAKARLALARELARRGSDKLAVDEARAALEICERLGALREADEAAAQLRSLGVSGRTGVRGLGELTTREREVLELLGHGLSNPEIAQRLFISPKTAEHHVSRILRKLNLRSRQEATAYAVRHFAQESGRK